MLDRALRALGIDALQWRTLVAAYLRMDVRAGGGAVGRGRMPKRRSVHPLAAPVVFMGFGGVILAAIAIGLHDPLVAATLLTTYGAMNTAMLLLVEFNTVVLSPEDYGVLGHRPVDSRTYFSARLSAVLVYMSALGAALAITPGLVFAFWRGLGVLSIVTTIAAVVLCNAVVTVLVVVAYVSAMSAVHPRRVRSVVSYLQLFAAAIFYGAYFVATRAFGNSLLQRIGFDEQPWLWANPASWFAAIAVLPGGGSTARWIAAAAGAALVALSIPLGAGRMTLEYARRIGELNATPAPPARRGTWAGLPGFRQDEPHAISLLIRAQFRFDQRFRLAVLGILPLMGFYLVLGYDSGALSDPFTAARAGATPLYMAIVFIPLIIHASLQYTEGWRAAWIFFSTPASAARLVVAAKNFVAIFFVGGFVLVLGGIWSFFFDKVWHAVFHAGVVASLSHMLLQVAVIVQPAIPFSVEPRRGQESSRLLLVQLIGTSGAAAVSLTLPFVYESTIATAALVVLIVAATGALEYTLRRRIATAIADLEFPA